MTDDIDKITETAYEEKRDESHRRELHLIETDKSSFNNDYERFLTEVLRVLEYAELEEYTMSHDTVNDLDILKTHYDKYFSDLHKRHHSTGTNTLKLIYDYAKFLNFCNGLLLHTNGIDKDVYSEIKDKCTTILHINSGDNYNISYTFIEDKIAPKKESQLEKYLDGEADSSITRILSTITIVRDSGESTKKSIYEFQFNPSRSVDLSDSIDSIKDLLLVSMVLNLTKAAILNDYKEVLNKTFRFYTGITYNGRWVSIVNYITDKYLKNY